VSGVATIIHEATGIRYLLIGVLPDTAHGEPDWDAIAEEIRAHLAGGPAPSWTLLRVEPS
jgi:hypothetical protein